MKRFYEALAFTVYGAVISVAMNVVPLLIVLPRVLAHAQANAHSDNVTALAGLVHFVFGLIPLTFFGVFGTAFWYLRRRSFDRWTQGAVLGALAVIVVFILHILLIGGGVFIAGIHKGSISHAFGAMLSMVVISMIVGSFLLSTFVIAGAAAGALYVPLRRLLLRTAFSNRSETAVPSVRWRQLKLTALIVIICLAVPAASWLFGTLLNWSAASALTSATSP